MFKLSDVKKRQSELVVRPPFLLHDVPEVNVAVDETIEAEGVEDRLGRVGIRVGVRVGKLPCGTLRAAQVLGRETPTGDWRARCR